MKPWPIRLRLAAWTALVATLALMVFGALTLWQVSVAQTDQLDRQIKAEAHILMATIKEAEHNPEEWAEEWKEVKNLASGMRGRFVEIDSMIEGHSLRSSNLNGMPLPPATVDTNRFTTRFDGQRLRVGVFRKSGTVLRIGASLEPSDGALRDLLRAFAVALAAVSLVLAAGCWWIARQALRPIEMLARNAEKITARRLDQRLPVLRPGDEVGLLTTVLNRMIDRLETSFQEVAQFTSDAAHELRTPLTIMRGEIEAAVRSGTYTPEQEKFLMSLLGDTAHLSTIVSNLLLLARADSGRLGLQLSPLDLSVLLEEIVEDAGILAEPQQIAIHAEITPGIKVLADRARLRQVLLNLFDNAVKYNHRGGEIAVRLRQEEATAHLTIRNTGPGIAPDHQARIFQRFYQGDSARSDEVEGQGLGLSICRELLRAHGGRIELAECRPGCVEFQVHLKTLVDGRHSANSPGFHSSKALHA